MAVNGIFAAQLRFAEIFFSIKLCKLAKLLVFFLSEIFFFFKKRIPFSKMKKVEIFRENTNEQMKIFLKTVRKKVNENQFNDLKTNVNPFLDL